MSTEALRTTLHATTCHVLSCSYNKKSEFIWFHQFLKRGERNFEQIMDAPFPIKRWNHITSTYLSSRYLIWPMYARCQLRQYRSLILFEIFLRVSYGHATVLKNSKIEWFHRFLKMERPFSEQTVGDRIFKIKTKSCDLNMEVHDIAGHIRKCR